MKTDQIIQYYVDDVALFLPRRIRNDVGLELKSLLIEQINAHKAETGIEPNVEVVLQLLKSYGRPEEVAKRYCSSGFTIIEPADAPSFVKIAVIGVLVQWFISSFAYYSATSSQGSGAFEKLGYWWLSSGLGALWWPGFLVCCYGFSTWLKQRRPTSKIWQPKLNEVDHDNMNTLTLTFLIISSFIGVAYLYTGPAWLIERLIPTDINLSWAVYADDFRSLWLPLFASLFIAQIIICIPVIMKGRWTNGTRWADLSLSLAWVIILIACGLSGKMFALNTSDEIARFILLVIAFFVAIDVIIKVRKKLLLMRMPALNV